MPELYFSWSNPPKTDGRILEVVAELHAFGLERAERTRLVDAAQAHAAKTHATQAAAFIADKKAVAEIVACRGKAAGRNAVKARKTAIDVHALAGIQIAAEAEPARGPVVDRSRLRMSCRPAEAKRRDHQDKTRSDCEHEHPCFRQCPVNIADGRSLQKDREPLASAAKITKAAREPLP